MTTEVQTKSHCDRIGCESETLRIGAEGGVPPVGWGKLSLSVREDGEGWTNRDHQEWELCPRCIRAVKALMNLGEAVR